MAVGAPYLPNQCSMNQRVMSADKTMLFLIYFSASPLPRQIKYFCAALVHI